jgi:hypothetical protein
VIHITRSNVIVMSGAWSIVDLPMYAAPLDRRAASHWSTPAPLINSRRSADWVPYGPIVAREHLWLDRGEQKLCQFRQAYNRCQYRVTAVNAPISLRVALPADELVSALTRVAGRGVIEVNDCRLTLDPTTLRDGDETVTSVMNGRVCMPWQFGQLEVVAAARPWSSTRADLVLTPTGRHRLRYPRRWFTVGFALADELRRRFTLPTG